MNSILSADRLERLRGWGGAVDAVGYVWRPSTLDQLRDILALARDTKRHVTLRGAGRSYGDASIGSESIVIELTRMNRILAWDPVEGIITCEAGVTLEQLWKYCITDGWWPPVVSGTMYPTLGGLVSMNIHGKNNFKVGPIGDHVRAFDLMRTDGQVIHVTRESDRELFYAAIGGFGMLGIILSVTLQMKHIESGWLNVESIRAKNFSELFPVFDERLPHSDYLVGWVDAFATGEQLGRAQIHQANYVHAPDDPAPQQSLRVGAQELPANIMGFVPKSIVWLLLRPLMNQFGWRWINRAKYLMSALESRGGTFRQSHAGFAFLLDYIPDWKKSYGPGGLIQYQSFIPAEHAERVFRRQFELSQQHKQVPLLAVFKRHKRDAFLMSHAVDGYSMALDYKVTQKNRDAVWQLAREMNEIVLEAGGRFYFAKDATLTVDAVRRFLGAQTLERFLALKKQLDPEAMLETDLSRRVLPLGSA